MSGEPTYSYKPSSFGAPWEFTLKGEGLAWSAGMRSALVRYDKIRRVRLSFRPVAMQGYRFQTEIWSDDMPKIRIASTSWRGIVEQARQDANYTAFVAEFHRRIAAAGARAEFSTGVPGLTYWLGVAVFFAAALGLAALSVRALSSSQWGGAAIIGGFLALFIWQLGNYFRRNRPGIYRPDNIPEIVLPRL